VSRFASLFERLRARGDRALGPYLTAGDPSLELTGRLAIEAERRGADMLELGVPFSDPLADGPVIQRAGQRALAGGVSLMRILDLVHTVRSELTIPIALMTYYNPVFTFGLRAFAAQDDMDLDKSLPMLRDKLAEILGTEDAREGLMAFLEKRPPVWKGK